MATWRILLWGDVQLLATGHLFRGQPLGGGGGGSAKGDDFVGEGQMFLTILVSDQAKNMKNRDELSKDVVFQPG